MLLPYGQNKLMFFTGNMCLGGLRFEASCFLHYKNTIADTTNFCFLSDLAKNTPPSCPHGDNTYRRTLGFSLQQY